MVPLAALVCARRDDLSIEAWVERAVGDALGVEEARTVAAPRPARIDQRFPSLFVDKRRR